MFRDSNRSLMADNHFGAGSVVCGGESSSAKERFLVVSDGNRVALISNETFELASEWIEVVDTNFISGEEARKLCHQIGNMLGWTFTDFCFSSKGMKNSKFSATDAK